MAKKLTDHNSMTIAEALAFQNQSDSKPDHELESKLDVVDAWIGLAKMLNSQEKLEIIAASLIEMAIENSSIKNFLSVAKFCKIIGSHKVEWIEDGSAKETDIKKELLLRCRYELKGVKKEEDELFRMSEAIEVAAIPEKKTQLESEYQEFKSRAKPKAFHLFNFFGALLRVEMIPENVMHECLVHLLKFSFDSEYLVQRFCVLITICGKYLDTPEAKACVDCYFEQIGYILKKRRVSRPVKLMLQEVQELRKNNWTRTELNKAEHRWVRSPEALATMPEEERETAIVLGKLRAILNKLTPQKFQKLAEQALQLKINTEERLKGCVDLIFTRILQPKECFFSIAYTNLCKVMSPLKVEWEEEGKMIQTNFRRELLTKCQVEFERDKRDTKKRDRMTKFIKEAGSKQLEDELEDLIAKARNRSLGNIRFIGELFKLSMLSETIMHECIVRLLKSTSDEESLECFARLITTTGKELDTQKAKTRIDGYFTRIAHIIKKGKISTRIRFMLQDVQELRKNDWVPRQSQASTLKTIDQIHAEAKQKKEEDKRMAAQHHAAMGYSRGGGSVDDRRRGSGMKEEWSNKGEKEKARREKPKMDKSRLAALETRLSD